MVKGEIMVVLQILVAVMATATCQNLVMRIQTPRMKEVIDDVTPPMTTTATIVGILVILLLNALWTCYLKSRNRSCPCMLINHLLALAHHVLIHLHPAMSHFMPIPVLHHLLNHIMTHHRFTVDSNDKEAYVSDKYNSPREKHYCGNVCHVDCDIVVEKFL
jgi:hypothetical protein